MATGKISVWSSCKCAVCFAFTHLWAAGANAVGKLITALGSFHRISEDHIPPKCYIPWCPTLQSHTPRSWLEHPTGLGLRGVIVLLGLGVFFSCRNMITSPTLSWMPFYCVYLQKQQHLIMCWEAACCLVNSEIIFRCILQAFFSLRKLRGLCSKYPGIRYLWGPPHFVSWKHKSPFPLLTLVGLNRWFEEELNV